MLDMLPAPTVCREPNFLHPSRYGLCGQFIHQCSLIFDQEPYSCVNIISKVAFIMSLLTGQAVSWALSASIARPELWSSFPEFIADLRRVFHHPVQGREARGQLLDCSQGRQSLADYSIALRILAAVSGFDDCALRRIFRCRLSALKDELAVRDDSSNMEVLQWGRSSMGALL